MGLVHGPKREIKAKLGFCLDMPMPQQRTLMARGIGPCGPSRKSHFSVRPCNLARIES